MIAGVVTSLIAALAAADGASAAAPHVILTEHNDHGFNLEISGVNTAPWRDEGVFTLSACPQAKCFRISGPLKTPSNEGGLMEGAFSIPTADCEIHFLEVPHGGMDSSQYRVTLIASDEAGKGCAYLPADLQGFYR